MLWAKELRTVEEIILRAGVELLTLREKGRVVQISEKAHDFVTNADHASDELIRRELKLAFPDVLFYSEESGGDASSAANHWVVDPLDGTVNYKSGLPFWGISIGRMHGGEKALGCVYLPDLRRLFSAHAENDAAFMWEVLRPAYKIVERGGERDIWSPAVLGDVVTLRASDQSEIAKTRVFVDHVKGDDRDREMVSKIFHVLSLRTMLPGVPICASASMAFVAQGVIDAYVMMKPKPEDTAAGELIVEKAGGSIIHKFPCPESVIATNGLINDELIRIITDGLLVQFRLSTLF